MSEAQVSPLRKFSQRLIRHRRRRQGRHDGGLLFRSPFRAIKLVRFRRKRRFVTARRLYLTVQGGRLNIIWVLPPDARP